jgi:hypothetical protein
MKRCRGSDQRIQAGSAARTRMGAALPAPRFDENAALVDLHSYRCEISGATSIQCASIHALAPFSCPDFPLGRMLGNGDVSALAPPLQGWVEEHDDASPNGSTDN